MAAGPPAAGTVAAGCFEVRGRAGVVRDLVAWALADETPVAPAVVLVDPDEVDWDALPGGAIVVVTTETVGPDEAAELVLRGADGVVSVAAGLEAVRDAVSTVAAGGTVLEPRAARRLADVARRAAAGSGTVAALSGRERQILDCIAAGLSVKQTAAALGVAGKTVENLQSRLFRKLGARNRAQAVARAHALGLLAG